MNVYIFQAALLCEDCGFYAKQNRTPAEDSDAYPQGPYADGGGESDAPQHCDACGEFLENPLTSDGYAYVAQAIVAKLASKRTSWPVALSDWAEFYDLDTLPQLIAATEEQ